MNNKSSKAKNWPAAPEGYQGSSLLPSQGYNTQKPCASTRCCNAPTICRLKSWETEYSSQFKHGRINLTTENCLRKSECKREASSRRMSSSCGFCKPAYQPGSSKRSVPPSISTENNWAKRWKDNEGQVQYNVDEEEIDDWLNSCFIISVKSHLRDTTEENRLAKPEPLPNLQNIKSRLDGNQGQSNTPAKSPTRPVAKAKRKNVSHARPEPNVGGEKSKRGSQESSSTDYILVKTTKTKKTPVKSKVRARLEPNVGGEKPKKGSQESTSSDYILVKTTRTKKTPVKSKVRKSNVDKQE